MTFGPFAAADAATPSGGSATRLVLGYFDKDTVIDAITVGEVTPITTGVSLTPAYAADPETATNSSFALGGITAVADTGDIGTAGGTLTLTQASGAVIPAGNWLTIDFGGVLTGMVGYTFTIRFRQFRI